MASLEYFSAPGTGKFLTDTYHYSQVVKLPNGIYRLSGQGGWDAEKPELPDNHEKQVALAFENVDIQLKFAGLRGWEDVYQVRSYSTDMDQNLEYIVENLKKWCKGHKPVYTALSVPRLALPDMKIEIEVEAYDSKSA
jgi:enamine deaminase RidA (YjgF/YER057c/UK114 family)